MAKAVIIFLAFILMFFAGTATQAGPMAGGQIVFKWDASVSEDATNYTLYYGKASRKSAEAVAGIPAAIEKGCLAGRDRDKANESLFQDCVKSWQEYCTNLEDKACDPDYFEYDQKTLTGNVTTYTLKNLPDGFYYFALVANDDAGNFSKFADAELSHDVDATAPPAVLNFSAVAKDKAQWKVTVETVSPVD